MSSHLLRFNSYVQHDSKECYCFTNSYVNPFVYKVYSGVTHYHVSLCVLITLISKSLKKDRVILVHLNIHEIILTNIFTIPGFIPCGKLQWSVSCVPYFFSSSTTSYQDTHLQSLLMKFLSYFYSFKSVISSSSTIKYEY